MPGRLILPNRQPCMTPLAHASTPVVIVPRQVIANAEVRAPLVVVRADWDFKHLTRCSTACDAIPCLSDGALDALLLNNFLINAVSNLACILAPCPIQVFLVCLPSPLIVARCLVLLPGLLDPDLWVLLNCSKGPCQ